MDFKNIIFIFKSKKIYFIVFLFLIIYGFIFIWMKHIPKLNNPIVYDFYAVGDGGSIYIRMIDDNKKEFRFAQIGHIGVPEDGFSVVYWTSPNIWFIPYSPSKKSLAEKKLLNFIKNWLKNNKQPDIQGISSEVIISMVSSIKNTLSIRNK